MQPLSRRYRIEQGFAGPPAGGTEGALCGPEGSETGEILVIVRELRRLLDPAQGLATGMVEAYRKELAEIYRLRADLDAMKEAITSTKREIASLYRSESEGKGMRRVAGELDAVVEATEQATTRILAAVEEIETEANMLRAAGIATGNNDCVGAILERVVSLYEACNFQDLTGQRITKIVGVLKFVEERLDKMIAMWGGLEAFKDLAGLEREAGPADHRSLLNGPRLARDEGHVSQHDIDTLFG